MLELDPRRKEYQLNLAKGKEGEEGTPSYEVTELNVILFSSARMRVVPPRYPHVNFAELCLSQVEAYKLRRGAFLDRDLRPW